MRPPDSSSGSPGRFPARPPRRQVRPFPATAPRRFRPRRSKEEPPMRFFALPPEIQARVAVVIPLVALCLSLFVVYPAWGRYNGLRAQIAQQERELSDLRTAPLPAPVAPDSIVEA